jgi:hypothetical protein
METIDKKYCPRCSSQISTSAVICPQCSLLQRAGKIQSNVPKPQPNKEELILGVISLSYPFWGAFITGALSCLISEAFLLLGILVGIVSGTPILITKKLETVVKIVLFPAYYIFGSLVVFVVGWGSLCIFCESCN